MELNKQHRESLLNELYKAKKDKEIQNKCLKELEDKDLNNWFEISIFLADKRIELIEKSLIDNEIDF